MRIIYPYIYIWLSFHSIFGCCGRWMTLESKAVFQEDLDLGLKITAENYRLLFTYIETYIIIIVRFLLSQYTLFFITCHSYVYLISELFLTITSRTVDHTMLYIMIQLTTLFITFKLESNYYYKQHRSNVPRLSQS